MSVVPLLSAQELSKTFGIKNLFNNISFSINPNEKVALIGPNGSGKSTLLKIFAGLEDSDTGNVHPRRDLRSIYVPQEDRFDEKLTVFQTLIQVLVAAGHEEYEIEGRVGVEIGRAGFKDKDAIVGTLSGGWKKRLAIIRGLILDPELLLLDEPTNHLDIDGVLWLEDLLNKNTNAIVFISHDRYFIARLAERVVELNKRYPQGYFCADGDYGDFLEARALYLTGLKQTQESLANRVRREVEWLRQGAKARTTKSKYRSNEALKLVDELKNSKFDDRKAQLEFSTSNRKTRDLIKVEEITKSISGRTLFKDISVTLSPGVRLGIVGPNGSGKTTFVKTLLGELQPDQGKITRANHLRVSFFDQARKLLDRSVTLKRALAPQGGDSVLFNGQSMHVVSWARRFLFSNEQLSVPVSSLSGGEQARVLLAQLMLQESDIILFDEPTNDLDIATLEVLEESFCEFPGAIVLVTHDRYLLDRTATTILGLSSNGGSFFASYLQWEAQHQSELNNPSSGKLKIATNNLTNKPDFSTVIVKLTQEENRELRGIESKIVKTEAELIKLQQEIMSEKISRDAAALNKCCEAIALQQKTIENLYKRWEVLEQKR
ncbi:MAG: ABC-F family ATP-binding cassette domain-containing protein [bacterium]|nr:ABC-F family ATP-binding cassette domain-containing protein [bacterium]